MESSLQIKCGSTASLRPYTGTTFARRFTISLSQINLTAYDTVVAVTQASINQTLAVFLNRLKQQVELYYNVDNNGDFVPASDPASAVYVFQGMLSYTLDTNGHPVDMVQLNSHADPQKVTYNITFSNAMFTSTAAPTFSLSQQRGSKPWVISFLVNLSHTETPLASLSSETQAAIQQATSNLGANMFSIQQLYLDLDKPGSSVFENITGMTSFAGAILEAIMRSYLASLQQSGGIIFGYSVHFTALNQAPPTFMPTGVDYCITPYTDTSGNHSNPGLDTLNYLVTTNNNTLPPQVPSGFGFNWVDDPSLQGAMAVRHGLYLNFLIGQLNPILQTISPVCSVEPDPDQTTDNQPMNLKPGVASTFQAVNPPQNGVIAKYSYSSVPASQSATFIGGRLAVSLSYSSTSQVVVNGPTVSISGSSVISAESRATYSGDSQPSIDDVVMPPTTYPWSVDLLLEMDPTNNGRLTYVIRNQNFSSKPTVAQQNQTAWGTFVNRLSGLFQEFVEDPGGIRETLQEQVLTQIQPMLARAIQTANSFVFPGAATFLFKNPAFTNTGDLAANITYMTPSATRVGI